MADDHVEVHNPIEVQRYLSGVNYPVSKDTLVTHAEGHGAPEEIRALLDRLPADDFDSPAAVSKAIGRLNR